MKKYLVFLAAISAAVVVSCNKNEQVSVSQDGAIIFRSSFAAQTKAPETTNTNIGSFNVTAIGNGASYFSDLAVTVDGSGNCTTAKTYYWPSYGLSFFAYANLSGGTAAITNASKMVNGVTPDAAAASQKDFVVAYSTGTKAANEASGVALNFRHALSQVIIKAKNMSSSGIKIKVKGVKIANILNSGNFTYPDAVTTPRNGGTLASSLWNTTGATPADYVISDATGLTLDGTAQSIMFAGASWMVVPQDLTARVSFADAADHGSSIGVLLQILDKDDGQLYPATAGEYAYSNIPIDTNWEPGKKYIYTLNFLDEGNDGGAGVDDNDDPVLGKPIKFTLTVDDWVDVVVPDITVE